MRLQTLLVVMVLPTLAACGGDSGGGPSIHDTKYTTVHTGQCVEDSVTGLLWEVKTETAGLHDWRNTYSWFNPDEANDELDYRGLADGGQCAGSACDTDAFVRAVNEAGHCGYRDWRVPARDELMSISDLSRSQTPPTANVDHFPHMQPAEYWTAYDYPSHFQSAWAWSYLYGHDRVDWKASPKFVRLVRGTPRNLEEVKD